MGMQKAVPRWRLIMCFHGMFDLAMLLVSCIAWESALVVTMTSSSAHHVECFNDGLRSEHCAVCRDLEVAKCWNFLMAQLAKYYRDKLRVEWLPLSYQQKKCTVFPRSAVETVWKHHRLAAADGRPNCIFRIIRNNSFNTVCILQSWSSITKYRQKFDVYTWVHL